MTETEITQERNKLRDLGCNSWNGTEEQKRRCCELDCIGMINSILAYQPYNRNGASVLEVEERSCHNYLARYVQKLGKTRVIELIEDQIKDIKGVQCSVFTDEEGCSYNSIIWAR